MKSDGGLAASCEPLVLKLLLGALTLTITRLYVDTSLLLIECVQLLILTVRSRIKVDLLAMPSKIRTELLIRDTIDLFLLATVLMCQLLRLDEFRIRSEMHRSHLSMHFSHHSYILRDEARIPVLCIPSHHRLEKQSLCE